MQDIFHILANYTTNFYYYSTSEAIATTTVSSIVIGSVVNLTTTLSPAMSPCGLPLDSHSMATGGMAVSSVNTDSNLSLTFLAVIVISGVFLSRLGLAFVLAPATRILFEILRTPTVPSKRKNDAESGLTQSESTTELIPNDEVKDSKDKDDKTKDLNTSSAVSAVYNSLMSLGGFIGLVFSGPSVDNLGYPVTSSILAAFIGFSAIIVGSAVGYQAYNRYQNKKKLAILKHQSSQASLLTTGEETASLLSVGKEKLR